MTSPGFFWTTRNSEDFFLSCHPPAPEKPAFTWFYCKTLDAISVSFLPRVCRETAKLKICDKSCVNREKTAPGSHVSHAGEKRVGVRVPSISIRAEDGIGRVDRHFGRLHDGPAICLSGVGPFSSLLHRCASLYLIFRSGAFLIRRFCNVPWKDTIRFDATSNPVQFLRDGDICGMTAFRLILDNILPTNVSLYIQPWENHICYRQTVTYGDFLNTEDTQK